HAFYARTTTIFADCGQSEIGSEGEIVFQDEPVEYAVVDPAKLAKAFSLFDVGQQSREPVAQPVPADNDAELKKLQRFVDLVGEAIVRGPSAEEFRMQNYVIELASRN